METMQKALLERLYEREKALYYSKRYNYKKHQAIVKKIARLESGLK